MMLSFRTEGVFSVFGMFMFVFLFFLISWSSYGLPQKLRQWRLCAFELPLLWGKITLHFFVILSPSLRYSAIANKWNKLMKQFMCSNFLYPLNIFYIFFKSKKRNLVVRFLHIAGGGWMNETLGKRITWLQYIAGFMKYPKCSIW